MDDLGNLARRAAQGDGEAWARLADALRGPLFAVAYAELGHYEDARDAAANAFLRVCRALPTLRHPERARAWAARIARHEARRLRAKSGPPLIPDATPARGAWDADSTLRVDVARALRTLPGELARAVSLYYLEGYAVAEIARALNRPEGTVKFWLHRGRAHLRARLEGYEPMEMNPPEILVIVGSELPADLRAGMGDACRAAGWGEVRHSAAPSPLLPRAEGSGRAGLTPPFADCGCVVLDERVSGVSAFEWLLLFRATERGNAVPVLLLLDAEGPGGNGDDRVLAAYLAGFDMCLCRPFDVREFRNFAARLRTLPTGG